MKTILVTGGIGSGKSCVCEYLAERGIPVYNADERTKRLYEGPLLEAVERAFGRPFRKGDHVDFAALSAAAFASPSSLSLLESIVHPAVLEDFKTWRAAQEGAAYVAMESAIALEKPLFSGCFDLVVSVYAPEELRMERVRRRNPALSETEIRRRIAAQRTDFGQADYLLINDATPEALRVQADALYRQLNKI